MIKKEKEKAKSLKYKQLANEYNEKIKSNRYSAWEKVGLIFELKEKLKTLTY